MVIGNGTGFWNTMPTLLRRRFIGYFGERMFSPSSSTSPRASSFGYSA